MISKIVPLCSTNYFIAGSFFNKLQICAIHGLIFTAIETHICGQKFIWVWLEVNRLAQQLIVSRIKLCHAWHNLIRLIFLNFVQPMLKRHGDKLQQTWAEFPGYPYQAWAQKPLNLCPYGQKITRLNKENNKTEEQK